MMGWGGGLFRGGGGDYSVGTIPGGGGDYSGGGDFSRGDFSG